MRKDQIAGAGARRALEPASSAPDDCDLMWSVCLAIAARRRAGLPATGFDVGSTRVLWHAELGWAPQGEWSEAAHDMFDLYRPLLEVPPGERYLVGHLGQSLDGRIATSSGDSCFINGQQNLVHMHRLRALCDAVLVGSVTVVADDPQLTTRMVPGPHACRVVLDPSRRLTPDHRVCTDGRCPTLIARRATPAGSMPQDERCGQAIVIGAAPSADGLDLPDLLETLGARGLHCILVEGGGITVSRFLAQRLLDRLQIAVAPLIIGSGRQGLQLPEVLALSECLRPSCRHYQMGPDILWDFDLRSTVAAATPAARPATSIRA